MSKKQVREAKRKSKKIYIPTTVDFYGRMVPTPPVIDIKDDDEKEIKVNVLKNRLSKFRDDNKKFGKELVQKTDFIY